MGKIDKKPGAFVGKIFYQEKPLGVNIILKKTSKMYSGFDFSDHLIIFLYWSFYH